MGPLRRVLAFFAQPRACETQECGTAACEECTVGSAVQLSEATSGVRSPVGMIPASQVGRQTTPSHTARLPVLGKIYGDILTLRIPDAIFSTSRARRLGPRRLARIFLFAAGAIGGLRRASGPAKCRTTATKPCENARRESCLGRFRLGGACGSSGGMVPAFTRNQEVGFMNLFIWLPAMFGLGLVTMIACYAFIGACEKI